jgi:Outer membrane protein beta-barrel domain
MPRYRSSPWLEVALLALALFMLVGPRSANALQIVPSIGISQSTDGGDNRTMVAVALRNGFLPRTQIEFQAGYRSEERTFAGESFELKTVPVTLSVWASPVPMLYAGGGMGAYLQAIEYQDNLYPASNETQFGAHLGGGFRLPLAPMVGLDLQGRYVFLGEQSNELTSGKFDPSFWTLSAGVAIGF